MNIIHFIQKPYIYLLSTLCLIIFSCSPKVLPPIETHTQIRDSVVVSYRDCTIVVPIERVVDIVRPYDTLFLSTSLAKAKAYIDTTTHTLKGEIENTQEVKYKYIYVDKIKVKDSLVYVDKPVPYPVEKTVKVVPWYMKVLSFIGTISIIALAIFIVLKLKI